MVPLLLLLLLFSSFSPSFLWITLNRVGLMIMGNDDCMTVMLIVITCPFACLCSLLIYNNRQTEEILYYHFDFGFGAWFCVTWLAVINSIMFLCSHSKMWNKGVFHKKRREKNLCTALSYKNARNIAETAYHV